MDKQDDMKMSHQPTNPTPQVIPSELSEPAPPSKKTHHTHRRPSRQQLWLGLLGLLVFLCLIGIVINKTTTKPAAISSSQVSIQSSGFFPKVISINAGSTVAWTNYDSSPHQVASDPYPKDDKLASLNSLAMQPKDSFSYTFASKGTYTYHDNLNPYKLQGTVVVE